jgi:hypothetical protein
MVELRLTNGEYDFFIPIAEYLTIQDLINELKKRITLNNPQLLFRGEPLNASSLISSFNFKNRAKIIFNDKYNGGKYNI